MISNQYITFQKSLLNKKCQEQDSHLNPYANLLFNTQWKSFPNGFTFSSPNKNKSTQTNVSFKNDILQWQYFALLNQFTFFILIDKLQQNIFFEVYKSREENILIRKFLQFFKQLSQVQQDVVATTDREFINKFIRFNSTQYDDRQINFKNQLTIANLFITQQRIKKFNQMKKNIKVVMKSDLILYLNFQHLSIHKFIQWLQQVTNNKLFQYAHKTVNKQLPEQNLLWFNSSSFHSLEQNFFNQIEKSIIKYYYKRDHLPKYKIKQFLAYMIEKYPTQAKYVKLTLEDAKKLSDQQIQNYCNIIKNYQQIYYEDLRQNFIQSLEILVQNDKNGKKKRKNKRKGKKKTSISPNKLSDNSIVNSPHKKVVHSENQKDSDNEQIQENSIVLQTINEQQQKNNQSTRQFEIQEQQVNQVNIIIPQTQNTQKQTAQKTNKKCICKQQTVSHSSDFKHQKKDSKNTSNGKNLVLNRQRSMSPYTKSNTIDNDCSKSMLSGQVFQTFTEAITQQCNTKAQQFEGLQNFDQQANQKNNPIEQQNHQQNKKRKRRKNNNINKNIEEMVNKSSSGLINKQLTNFIDNLSIQTNNLYQSKVICFQRVRFFIKNLFPQTQAMLFGSNSMGLSLPSSDVDIMLYNVPCGSKQQIKQILAQIAIQINAMGWIVSCSTYLNAKAPLVKLQIDPLISYFQTKRRCDYQNSYDPMILYYLDIKDRKKAKNIYVDLTINLQDRNNGYSPSTQLMRNYVNQNSTLQRIILVFKYILAQKGFNKNFNGGLGSYCLFIMITAYFKEFSKTLPQDQGQIFLNILKFYSQQFQNKLKSITLRQQTSCFISLQQTLNLGSHLSQIILSNPLRIIDPLTLNLMSSSCSQYNSIKCQFRRIRNNILAQFESIQKQITSNYSPVELGKMLSSQKSIEKWIYKYQTRTRFSIKKIIDGSSSQSR